MDRCSIQRVSCHRCGNNRKRKMECVACPYVYCARCVIKMREQHGANVFEKGCPVCKDLCCCGSKKSAHCTRKYHCYKKCPSTRSTQRRSFRYYIKDSASCLPCETHPISPQNPLLHSRIQNSQTYSDCNFIFDSLGMDHFFNSPAALLLSPSMRSNLWESPCPESRLAAITEPVSPDADSKLPRLHICPTTTSDNYDSVDITSALLALSNPNVGSVDGFEPPHPLTPNVDIFFTPLLNTGEGPCMGLSTFLQLHKKLVDVGKYLDTKMNKGKRKFTWSNGYDLMDEYSPPSENVYDARLRSESNTSIRCDTDWTVPIVILPTTDSNSSLASDATSIDANYSF